MRESKPTRRSRHTRGYTLLEAILVMTVVAVFATVLLSALRDTSAPASRQKAIRSASLLADEMMREMRSKAFEDPQTPATFGPEEGTVRRNYDDVDDYDGWTRSPPDTIEGIAMTQYAGYRIRVTVVNVTQSDLNPAVPPADGSTPFKRIAVVVSSPEVVVSNVSVVGRYD